MKPSLRRVNTLYALIHLFYWAAFAAFTGYQTALLLERGFSSGNAGVLTAVRCLAGILAQPLLGRWADRHPHIPLKHTLNLCLGLALAVNLLFYFTRPGLWGTAAIFFALGALELNAYPLLDSMAVQFISAGFQVNYSFGRGVGSLAYAVSSVLLGQQCSRFGVETVLLSHMGLLVLLMAVIAVYPTAPQALPADGGPTAQPHSLGYLLKSSPTFSLMLVSVFFAVAAVLPLVNFCVNIVSHLGGSESHLGLVLFLMAASEMPAALLFPHLWKKLGSRGMMVLSVGFMALKPLLFLLAPSLGFFLFIQPVQMLGYGLFTPASVYYANENVPPADRIQGQTVMMIASNGLGGTVGNLLAGYAIDLGGVSAMLIMCTGIGLIAVLFAIFAVKYEKKA